MEAKEIIPAEITLGVLLLKHPQVYRMLEENLLAYTPQSDLLRELIEAFRKADEIKGDLFYAQTYLSKEAYAFWMEQLQQVGGAISADYVEEVSKFRQYLENEARRQQIALLAKTVLDAVEYGESEDVVKESVFKLQSLLIQREHALKLADIPELLLNLKSESFRPKLHEFPFVSDLFGNKVYIYNNDITLIMGRTGRGKTTLALNLARTYIENGKVVCYVSTEMDERALATKFASIVSGVEWTRLWGESVEETLLEKAAANVRALSLAGGGLFIYHSPACTPSDIAYAASLTRSIYGKVDVVIVDYIQQVGSSLVRRDETRASELGRITREFADLVIDYGAAGVVVSQVNEKGDVKDSRAIAERAALVVRLGMMGYIEFERFVLKLLKMYDKHLDAEESSQLRALYKRLIDIEVVKNRYGFSSAGHIGFVEWEPTTGQFLQPWSLPQLIREVSKFISPDAKESEDERKGKRRRKGSFGDAPWVRGDYVMQHPMERMSPPGEAKGDIVEGESSDDDDDYEPLDSFIF